MGFLSFALLGSPEVRCDGQLLHFPTRKSLALLVYLAAEGGLHTREKLTALLWPDSPPKQGRAALRNTLLRLQATLKAGPNSGGKHLIKEGDSLGLDPDAGVEIDVCVLEALLSTSGGNQVLPGQLARVVALPRGDFLEGFSLPDAQEFDDWAAVQREHWYQKVDDAFDFLSQAQADTGMAFEAVETARRWVTLHPLNELAHNRLMEIYLSSGDREAALRALSACQKMLEEQLGVEPGPGTRAFARRIRNMDRLETRRGSRRLADESALTLVLPLVGRAEQHRQLVTAFRQCQQGRLKAIVLEGEPGIGKTRLAGDFLAWAAAQGAEVLFGRAFEAGGRLPYQPLIEALQPALSRQLDWPGMSGEERLANLAWIIPELRDRFPGLPETDPGRDAQAQTRLFDAVAYAAEILARSAPLVWCIDDLQWADSASLDLIQYLVNRWSQPSRALPGLLLFTRRSKALKTGRHQAADADLEAWLNTLGRVVPVQRLSLQAIGEQDVDILVKELAADSGDSRARDSFSRWLYAETEGQPLFILETLKALVEWGVIHPLRRPDRKWRLDYSVASGQDLASSAAFGLPPGIRDLIRARLARVSPGALSLLSAGATLGKRFSFRRVWLVSGLEEDATLSALDELLNAGLLGEARTSEHLAEALFVFSHDKIREVVVLETNTARRKHLHRRAFEVLQADGAPPAELSHHAIAAGLRWQGFETSRVAGDQALRLYALREAIGHYRAALETWELPGEATPPDAESQAARQTLPGLFLNLGRAYELLNEVEQAQVVYQQMGAHASANRMIGQEIMALNRQATLRAWQNFDIAGAKQILQQALDLAEKNAETGGLAETTWNLAQIGMYLNDPQAQEYAGQALSLARQLGRADLIARSLNLSAHIHTNASRWEETARDAREAYRLSEQLSDRAMQAENLALISQAQVNLGEIQAGLAFARQALKLAQEIENAWGQVFASFALGMALTDAGYYEEALTVTRQGTEIASQLRFPALAVLAQLAYGVSNIFLFRGDEALHAAQRGLAFNEPLIEFSRNTGVLHSLCCSAHAVAGDWPAAAEAARQAVFARYEQHGAGLNLPIWLEVDALLKAGQPEIARQDLDQLSRQTIDHPRQRITWLMARGVLAGRQGSHTAALEDLNKAFQLAEQYGSPWDRWVALKEISFNYRLSGALPEADQAFHRAEKIVQELADRIHDGAIRDVFLSRALQILVD